MVQQTITDESAITVSDEDMSNIQSDLSNRFQEINLLEPRVTSASRLSRVEHQTTLRRMHCHMICQPLIICATGNRSEVVGLIATYLLQLERTGQDLFVCTSEPLHQVTLDVLTAN